MNAWQIATIVLALIVLVLGYLLLSRPHPDQETKEPMTLPEPAPQKQPAAMLYFYSDSCPHSRAMTPVWDEASKELERMGLVVQKIPAGSPEAQQMGVNASPVVLFIAGPQGEPIKYSGNRTVESLIRFAASEGKEV